MISCSISISLTYFTKHNILLVPSVLSQIVRFHSFLWLSNTSIYHIFFIHSSIDGHFHILVIVNNVVMNIEMHVPSLVSAFVFSGIELLDHMVILFLIF